MRKRKKTEIASVKSSGNVRLLGMLVSLGWLVLCPMLVSAQCKAKNDAFQSGEVLDYELFFNWKFIWIKAGTAQMTVSDNTYFDQQVYRTRLQAVTSKRLDKVFRMRDTLDCVYTKDLEPIYFRKGAEEGKRFTIDEAWFDYREGKCYVDQKRAYRDGTFIQKRDTSEQCVFDMLSILAQARSFDPTSYKKGERILFPMVTGKRVEEQILIYRGKEDFEAENDTMYRCLVFSLVEMKGKKEKEVITFYITDDKNHLPVRLDLYLRFGSAKAFLKAASGLRNPQTSIVSKKGR